MRLLALSLATPLLVVTAALPLKRRSGDLKVASDDVADILEPWLESVTPSSTAVPYAKGVTLSTAPDKLSPVNHPTRDRIRKRNTKSEGKSPGMALPEPGHKSGVQPEKIRGSEVRSIDGLRAREIPSPEDVPELSTEIPPEDVPELSTEIPPEEAPEEAPEEPAEESLDQPLDSGANTSGEISGQAKSKGQKLREAWAKKTPEERAAINEKRLKTMEQKTPADLEEITQARSRGRLQRSAEDKAATVAKMMKTVEAKSPEERQSRVDKWRQTMANKSPEERLASAQKQSRTKLQKSDEEKAAIQAKRQQSYQQKSPEELAAIGDKVRETRARSQHLPEVRQETGKKIREALTRKSAEEKSLMSQRAQASRAKKQVEGTKTANDAETPLVDDSWDDDQLIGGDTVTRGNGGIGDDELIGGEGWTDGDELIGGAEPAGDEQQQTETNAPPTNPFSEDIGKLSSMASTAWDNLSPTLSTVAALPLMAIPFLRNANEGLLPSPAN